MSTAHSLSIKKHLNRERSDYKACVEEDEARERMKFHRDEMNRLARECEAEKFGVMCDFFIGNQNQFDVGKKLDKRATLNDLLQGLYWYYINKRYGSNINKTQGSDYRLSIREFIEAFPPDSQISTCGKPIEVPRKQHIFEALCRLLLVLNYDSNYWGKNKKFFAKLEGFNENMKALELKQIMSSPINDGSSAGSVDIFFKIPKVSEAQYEKQIKQNKTPACTIDFQRDKKDIKKDTYVLIQNKYYNEEKGQADKYDVLKIYNRASDLRSKVGNDNVKLSIMVNNKQRLLEKQSRVRMDDFKGIVSQENIFGLEELDQWFQSLLYDMLSSYKDKTVTIESLNTYFGEFYNSRVSQKSRDKPSLFLKFHQELIVNTTRAYLEGEVPRRKFVWGAVPRSGKSFMIAGLIRDRLQNGPANNVLIVLGAKTETELQFREMFEEFDEFNDYKVIVADPNSSKRKLVDNNDQRYILLLSQEQFKVKPKEFKTQFDKLRDNYEPVLGAGQKIDFYFDEIHKGGSSEKSGELILESLVSQDVGINLFVMVTATYAKPLSKYTDFLDGKNPIVLRWSYEDNQMMKNINNIDVRSQFKQSRASDESEIGTVVTETLDSLFESYEQRYGPEYLNILANEYQKYPSLVLIQPQIESENSDQAIVTHEGLLNLQCTAMPENEAELRDVSKIFKNSKAVEQLISYIGNFTDEGDGRVLIDPRCIYGKLRDPKTFNYDVLGSRHSELWFLPDSNLYGTADEETEKCRERIKEKKLIVRKSKGDKEAEDDDSEEKARANLPNFEPLARGMVLLLQKNPLFNKNYCFIVITRQKAQYFRSPALAAEDYIMSGECVSNFAHTKAKDVKEWIIQKERETYEKGKSLIILTGSMLRLGISLPCVDIGLNFDSLKSVDLNYQTMFRVLTERPGKQYGYYIDFYRDRTIQFLYQYAEIYSSKSLSKKLSADLEYMLFLFNINGIQLGQRSEKETTALYERLKTQLALNQDAFFKWASKGRKAVELYKMLLSNIEGLDEIVAEKDLGLKQEVPFRDRKRVQMELVKGQERMTAYREKEDDDDSEDYAEDEEESKDLSKKAIIERLASMANTVIPIIALFSERFNCDEPIACLNQMIRITEDGSGAVCDCNTDDFDVLACYLDLISEKKDALTREKYISRLESWRDLLQHQKMKEFYDSIKISFLSIREQMGQDDQMIFKMNNEQILEVIEKYLPVRKSEKDKFGEVFTPPELINEMFDQLPKEVWSNPDLKWLDPANGIGNFPMIAFERLNKGLEKKMPDEKKRKDHIIKKMLYMVELNAKNVAVSRKIFGKDANIYCGSFLEDGWKKAFNVDKFDVVMGNPPFNNEQENEGKKGGGDSLWPDFVIESLNLLKSNGYLVFVHPSAWRKPEGGKSKTLGMFELMTKENTMMYLEIHDTKDGKRVFDAGTRYDWYIIKKTPNNGYATKIKDQLGKDIKLDLNKVSFLPNFNIANVLKLFAKTPVNEDNVIYSRNQFGTDKSWTSPNKNSDFKYPLINSTAPGAKNPKYYSNTKEPDVKNFKPMFGVSKVILGESGGNTVNDFKGNFGMTQGAFGLVTTSITEANQMESAINTNFFREIKDSLSFGNFRLDWRLFTYLKPDWYKIVLLLDKKANKTRKLRVVSKLDSSKKTRKSSSSKSKSEPKSKSTSAAKKTKSKSRGSKSGGKKTRRKLSRK